MVDEFAFIDTNVFVYMFDNDEPAKQNRALELIDERPAARLATSPQVLGEFFNAVTRKLAPPLSAEQGLEEVARLAPLARVAIDRELVLAAITLRLAKSISYWDALIVSAAARLGCDVLLTEDLNDGEMIAGVRVVNPF